MDEKESKALKDAITTETAKGGISLFFYITLWIVLFRGEPDLIDAVIKILMNIN